MQVVPPLPAISQRKPSKEIVAEIIKFSNSEKVATAKKQLSAATLAVTDYSAETRRIDKTKPVAPLLINFGGDFENPKYRAALRAYEKQLTKFENLLAKIGERRLKVVEQYQIARNGIREIEIEAHQFFTVDKPIAVQFTGVPISAELQKGAAFVNQVVSSTLTNAENLTTRIVNNTAGRASSDGNSIFIRVDETASQMAHELGHILEQHLTTAGNAFSRNSPELLGEVAIRYRESRTIGESWEKLSEVTGDPYADYEVTKKDKFYDEYTGRRGNGLHASEIITMGLQHMYDDPIGFATNDPDHLEFMLTLLRGSE